MDTTGYAYSTLPEILVKERLTVADVYARLRTSGFKCDKKTLYRLASRKPIQSINAPIIKALCMELKTDLGKLLVWDPPKLKLHRIDEKTQGRLDYLMGKNTEGTLVKREREELEELAERVERLSFENAQMLAGSAARKKRIVRQRPSGR